MRRGIRSALAGAAVLALVAITSCAKSNEASKPPTGATSAKQAAYAARLQTTIPQVMSDNAIPGVVVLIKSREQGNWSATFGTAEIGKSIPMSMDDYFRVGSNTKTMTSTVILQLVQEGKLKLDDPVSKYRQGVPNGDKITIAQLSEMRSGLYSYTSDPAFNATLDSDPQKAWTPDQLLAIGLSRPVNFAPGEKYEYSNTNIVLLGVIIEQLTGMTASEALSKRIFEPLGLKKTSLPALTDSSIPDPHSQGYQFLTNAATIDSYAVPKSELSAAISGTLKPINFTNANPSWAWTAGGAISTVDDLATYVKALVGGGLLDEKTQKLRLDSIQPIVPGSPSSPGYGLGIARFGSSLMGHDGQIPGYSTFMAYDPKADITIIIATNLAASPVDGENASVVLAKAVMGTIYGSPAVPGGDPAGASKVGAGGSAPSVTPTVTGR